MKTLKILQSLINEQSKDKEFQAQTKIVLKAFQEKPRTVLMVCAKTKLDLVTIHRIVNTLLEEGKIQVVKKSFNTETKRKSRYFSSNPELFGKLKEGKKNVFLNATLYSLFSQLAVELMKSDAFFTNHNLKLS